MGHTLSAKALHHRVLPTASTVPNGLKRRSFSKLARLYPIKTFLCCISKQMAELLTGRNTPVQVLKTNLCPMQYG